MMAKAWVKNVIPASRANSKRQFDIVCLWYDGAAYSVETDTGRCYRWQIVDVEIFCDEAGTPVHVRLADQ